MARLTLSDQDGAGESQIGGHRARWGSPRATGERCVARRGPSTHPGSRDRRGDRWDWRRAALCVHIGHPPRRKSRPTTHAARDRAEPHRSWGRSTGKRLSAGLTKLTSGLGLGRSTKSTTTIGAGRERQHGKFAFEPPVPSLPTNLRRELSMDSGERERHWEREDKELGIKPQIAGKGHGASHSTSSTSSTHTGVSAGHRSGTKGRSLDLGLGLAWAPTKVREDAVMPESSFGRTLSASRREQQGKEVAEVFRTALNEDGYRSFKKYVHRFDAHEIPFDGPTGIVTRVERLLRKAQHLTDDEREKLLDAFVKLILQTA
ncbi:hypothetical protein B0H16DRAFT_195757 [Mycena metata]|uniref:Uncharacterized protein n=1 Tax=Mycena metata TaxID=1033252 RepID=A0AAD7JY13_9AGAR|nr:hypothetical protein B0H16DRAFT_195757 [Mycena metata]